MSNSMSKERGQHLVAIFPNREVGTDAGQIIAYAQAAEELGYWGITVYDHVILFEQPSGNNQYTVKQPFHEPLVLFGLLAGHTKSVNFITGVLVLPQRQTSLVAKQSAMVDLYSDGRLILGIGVGADESGLEYSAMGMGSIMKTRGMRMERQIKILRELWTQGAVTANIDAEYMVDAAINPRPNRRIPIWIGGYSPVAMRRTAVLGDGWIPMGWPEKTGVLVNEFRDLLGENKRDVHTYPIMVGFPRENPPRAFDPSNGTIFNFEDRIDAWRKVFTDWKKIGVSHIAFGTQGRGLTTVDEHILLLDKTMKLFNNEL